MLAAIPAMLKILKDRQADEAAGQLDIFAAPKAYDLRIPELPDWSLSEKLWWERWSTGAFFSGHPVDAARERRKHEITHDCGTLAELLDYGTSGDIVVCGLIVNVWPRKVVTIVEIEDRSGRAEIVFNRTARERFASLLYRDNIVLLALDIWHGENRSSFDVQKAKQVGRFASPASALSRGNRPG